MRGGLVPLLVLVMMASPCEAQKRFASVAAGPLSFDASGIGDSYTIAGRVVLPVAGVLQVQPGLSYSPFDEQFTAAPTRMFFVDAFVRAQMTSRRVKPFLAAGPVLAFYGSNDLGRESPETGYGAAIGLDASLRDGWIGVLDFRFRGWRLNGMSPVNGLVEATVGLGVAF